MVEYRSEPISRSDYHTQLDAQEQDGAHTASDEEEALTVEESKIRYWSDYSRVFFHPRSIHRLPDLPEWGDMDGDWAAGVETWQKYDDVSSMYMWVMASQIPKLVQDTDFMEDSFRTFVEECDNLQVCYSRHISYPILHICIGYPSHK